MPTTTITPSLPPRKRRPASDSLSGIFAVCLISALLAGFYFGRPVLVPLGLAALIGFLLSPVVNRLQRIIGNVAAVVASMMLVLATTVALGWVVGNQAVDLANQLPSYQENIRAKLQSIQAPGGGTLDRITEAVEGLKKDLPGSEEESTAMPVKVVNGGGSRTVDTVQTLLSQVAGPLGTAALVFLLATFMLLKREDLRSRMLRLIGQGRISTTTRALDEAGKRVRKYLLMQLVVNVTYGIPLAIGLYFIGVPNAVLWGALAAGLRFIPYIGPWIAAAFPVLLSLAVSPGWQVPLMTISLFVVLELASNNILEPWLYGASTGVSSIALIVSAVFWTWMWGTPGLVLSTPFTVCLVVMGRHIPQLSFLSVLMGEEEALSPADECYQRLLRRGEMDEFELAENFLRQRSMAELCDEMLMPVAVAAERDHRAGSIDREQRDQIMTALDELVEELSERPVTPDDAEILDLQVRCVAARADRDELAGRMVALYLGEKGCDVRSVPVGQAAAEVVDQLVKDDPDLVCISVVSPTKPSQALGWCRRLRSALPSARIAVGLWGRSDLSEGEVQSLREAGADEVYAKMADLSAYAARLAATGSDEEVAPAIPENEEQRLLALSKLGIANSDREPVLDRTVEKLAGIFEVPIAGVTLVDRDRQWFKADSGLPESLKEAGGTPRELSFCGHVVAADDLVVVRDLKRDRRFARNPLVTGQGLRFYAGAPIRTRDGLVIGTLCLLDTTPRVLSPRERRFLASCADEVASEIERMAEDENG